MLSDSKERQVLDLLAQGVNEYEVVRRTGVSRNAVRRIHKLQRQENKFTEVCFSYLLQVETGKEGRCPTCGKKGNLPCRSCLLAQYSKVSPGAQFTDDFHDIHKIKKELDSLEKPDPDEDQDEGDQDEDDQDEDDQGEDDATSQD